MSTATAEPTAPPGLFAKHFQQLVFATHVFEGKRQANAVDATIKGEKIASDRVGSPKISLLPPDLSKAIQQARQRVYAVLARHTVPCDSAGSRLVSVNNSEAFVAEFNSVVESFDQVADGVAARHAEIVDYSYAFWRGKFDSDEEYQKEIGRLIPSQERLRAAFSVEFRLSSPDAAHSAQFEDTAVSAFFEEAARNASEHQAEMIEALVKEPVSKLAAALSALKLQLNTGKKVTPGSFSAVTEAISLCKACADVIPDDVMARVKQIGLQVTGILDKAEHAKGNGGNYTDAIKPFKGTLSSAIDSVIEACQDDEAQNAVIARYGVQSRGLSFATDFEEDE